MKTQYIIQLWPRTREEDKQTEISRIDALFTKIEDRYWQWRDSKHQKDVADEVTLDMQREGEVKKLVSIFEKLNSHYTRLYFNVKEFNNIDLRFIIAEDKKQYKEFDTGLNTAKKIAIKYEETGITEITIWFGSKHKTSLSGIVNGYILDNIANRLPAPPYTSTISVSNGDPYFDKIRGIIKEETSKHIFEERYNPKSELQPLSERCCDLYSEIMEHRKWIFGNEHKLWPDSYKAGKMIIELLGLHFQENQPSHNKEETFISSLHPIRYKEDLSLSDIIKIDFE